MNIYKIIVIAYLALVSLGTVAQVGKKRQPLTPGGAVTVLLIEAALAALVVLA